MTDTDPEHEVGDIKAPEHSVRHAPDADTGGDEICQTTADADERDERRREEQQPPKERLFIFQNAADSLGDPMIGTPAEDKLFALEHRDLNPGVGLRCSMNGGCHDGVRKDLDRRL